MSPAAATVHLVEDAAQIEPLTPAPEAPSWLFRIGSTTLLALIGVHLSGVIGSASYGLTLACTAGLGLIGILTHRPKVRWPWILFVTSAVLWIGSAALSNGSETAGDLSKARSLLPDAVALSGYAIYGLGIFGLMRARGGARDSSSVLDGLILALGASLIVQYTLVSPTLTLNDTWLPARIAVIIYPTISIFLGGIATQLAFSRGGRAPALVLVMIGTGGLVVGDVVWAFGEVGYITTSVRMIEIPYLIVMVALGCATLHPSVRSIGSSAPDLVARPIRRYVAVSAALIAPASLVIFPGSVTPLVVVVSLSLCVVSAVRVVTAMRSEDVLRAKLLHRAMHDELTELPTRSLLVEEIERRLSANSTTKVAVLFIDLDRFKNVNDLMGHQTGDQLLVAVAERIAGTIREPDLLARISGDEFVVLTTGLDVESARKMGDRVRSALAQPFDLPSGDVSVTASVGVSVVDSTTQISASEILQQADTAMYESKVGRNGTTVFDSSMHERAIRRMEIERKLRHALNGPELSVAFQPIVDAQRNRACGFEALLRWHDPDGAIGPSEFVPIAEESGLIVPVGAYVLDEACRQAAYWRANVSGAQDLYVSVNLSPRQLIADDIVDMVAETLERHGLPADSLWLEITETVMTEDTTITAAALSGLRLLGVRLALDDFGTGYSSLSGLQFIPVSRLKIDRQFVSGLGIHHADDSLVKCITAVAESFDLDVVAEGVETREQLELLRKYGCSKFQGYYYSPAVPADEVPALLASLSRPTRRDLPVRAR